MDKTTIAHAVGFLSALFVLAGVTGVTAQDVSGFFNVVLGLITLVSFVYAHFSHKASVAA